MNLYSGTSVNDCSDDTNGIHIGDINKISTDVDQRVVQRFGELELLSATEDDILAQERGGKKRSRR